ncbi:putative RNA recognition motif domain, nucleotide-binding alpha-beta plait domain superfamily [Helianthus annuus]|uniref:Putative nucleotide-binding alpha-beta plait domain-containing protein n=1 Tax=Helianthus annuus TaxID=4232 RepID=A0A251SZH5_HELAN|nr:oligouridylate-binding protein 1B [Helianthus annuus]KAF5776826.1 putative RNA recognition motif domain, nucleotide-binding alpha-beta plait domain superfamily [Helianthus annuus]KAJ0488484.1 putative RNA recognition motif domain, nucleotide-binding alpha-beta plait domain superfamily [Helianthus annuus]KAJ0491985.1 putative RNA recognition motif domain, nucleotide-binding alpha-beta plait domain superfamily [Helianthus annuus]KAJ0504312.1 putative RNA recognition motif domain, nucleotide-bi
MQNQHQRLKLQQQQALMQQALLQQQSLYHPGLLAPPQIEPIPSGNLPPGFDPNTCRSVYAGNIHIQVTEPLLQEVFASTGPVEGCKLIRKEKSSYGFIHYFDRRSAALAILSLNGRHLFGQPIKVNWAYASGQREDTSGHYNIFVGDLSPEVTDAMLFACFSVYASCSDARVMWDQKTGRSRGFGFVSFRTQQDAQSAINDLTGKWLGSRQIRCNWATKGAGTSDEKQASDSKSVVELTNGSSEDSKEPVNGDAPENNPQYTTVYVGNLAPEVTQLELHRHFHSFGAGIIEEVRVQPDKGFGFVRYNNHAEAALAIQMGNTQSILYGKQIKCSWGSKPTPPGTTSNPLPPPVPAPMLSAADLLAYERQFAMSKMGGVHGLMHAQGQFPLKPASMGGMGMGAAGASQAIYDGFPNVAATQQLMYYQ